MTSPTRMRRRERLRSPKRARIRSRCWITVCAASRTHWSPIDSKFRNKTFEEGIHARFATQPLDHRSPWHHQRISIELECFAFCNHSESLSKKRSHTGWLAPPAWLRRAREAPSSPESASVRRTRASGARGGRPSRCNECFLMICARDLTHKVTSSSRITSIRTSSRRAERSSMPS